MVEEEEEEAEFCSIVCLLVSFRFVSTRWFAKVRSPLNGIEVSPRGGGRGRGKEKKVWFAKVVASRLFDAR